MVITNQRVWFVRDEKINRGVVVDWGKLDGEDVVFVRGHVGWMDKIWVVKEGEYDRITSGN